MGRGGWNRIPSDAKAQKLSEALLIMMMKSRAHVKRINESTPSLKESTVSDI